MKAKAEIHLRSNTYQPRKKEMLEDVSINATPEELAEAVLWPVKILREDQSRRSETKQKL